MRSRLLAAVLAALMAGIGIMQLGGPAAVAQTPDSGLNFWIAVEGVPACNTQTGNGACNLALGSTFVVDVNLDPLPSDLPRYDGFDIKLTYTGVTPNHDASMDAWPDCAFPAIAYNEPPRLDTAVLFGCAIGIPPAGPSTYTGLIGTNSFICAQSGIITLAHGESGTDLLDDQIQPHAEASATGDILTINCVPNGVQPPPVTPHAGTTSAPPVTPLEPTAAAKATSTAQQQATATAKAVATAGKTTPGNSGNKSSGGGGLSGGVIAIIIVAGVAAAGVAGVAGWRVMQSRGGGGAPVA